jgi:hypothetical protein
MRRLPALGLAVVVVSVVGSCSAPPPPRVCSPGSSQTCSALGCVGVQRCNATGTAFESCSCMGTGAGGPGPGVGGSGPGVGGGGATAGGGATSGGGAGGGTAGGGAVSCGPGTCSGCCSGSQCVLPPNNANNTTCGINGAACANCAAANSLCNPIGFTCNSGAGGGGAGGGAGGGGSFCDGCVLQNGMCQPRGTNRQNNSICGSFGQACMACPGGTVCDFGACVSPGRQVGDACVTNSECQATLGSTALCLQSNLSGSVPFTGGFCTIENCVSSTMTDLCPMGSACLNIPRIFGFERSTCFRTGCTTSSCRTGYTCSSLGAGSGLTACLPTALTNPNLPLDTTSVIGLPCTFRSECRAPSFGAPFAGGFCVSELRRFPDGGLVMPVQQTGFTGGYCSRECRIDDDCSSTGAEDFTEGVCLGSDTLACYRGCTTPGLGQGACRTGYVCERLLLLDGGVFGTGFCDIRCDSVGAPACRSGTTCNASGYCR